MRADAVFPALPLLRLTRLTRLVWLGMGVVTLVVPSLALSQAAAEFKPFGECRTGFWHSSRNLDDAGALNSSTCLLNLKLQPVENLRFAANARLSQAVGSEGSMYRGRLREAYAQADFGDVSVKLGRQIVVWGRSDRISPTDVMSSRDFTALVADDDEQRNGNDLATLRWQVLDDVAATAYIGRFEGHRIPTGSLPVNLVTSAAQQRPEYALRIERVGEGADFSVSYFDGFNKAARYDFVQGGVSGNFRSHNERMRMVGADFATATGRWTFRAEAALFHLNPSCVDCQAGALPTRKLQRLVVGVDRDFLDTANINVQLYIFKRNGYKNPDALVGAQRLVAEGLDRLNGEFAGLERGMTLRVSERFLNDLLKVEASGLFDLTSASRLLRARLSYAISDQIKLNAGVDSFHGRQQSFFGSRRKNSTAFVELVWVF